MSEKNPYLIQTEINMLGAVMAIFTIYVLDLNNRLHPFRDHLFMLLLLFGLFVILIRPCTF